MMRMKTHPLSLIADVSLLYILACTEAALAAKPAVVLVIPSAAPAPDTVFSATGVGRSGPPTVKKILDI